MEQTLIHAATSTRTLENLWDHVQARVGINRMGHIVQPGLYALGKPTAKSPVFVSANYTLSFDALRYALAGIDGYILVLDTKGVNVWCAAGEGTFGTNELVHRIEAVVLHKVVDHRVLIVPQLGAPGISAHEVKKRSGFRVEYGPVRAADLPEYLKTHQATVQMRQVCFDLRDRLAVAVVDIVNAVPLTLAVGIIGYLVMGLLGAAAVVVAALAAVVLFPALLPWLPARDFTIKGLALGLAVMLPFAWAAFTHNPEAAWWLRTASALAYLFTLPPLVAYLALLFTGSTTFTSPSGVRREIFAYTRPLVAALAVGVVLIAAVTWYRLMGGVV